jgi:hypothetical protein
LGLNWDTGTSAMPVLPFAVAVLLTPSAVAVSVVPVLVPGVCVKVEVSGTAASAPEAAKTADNSAISIRIN